MSSHVVVIAASARRHTVKTTPGKYLSDVLAEACQKFGFDSEQYGLKHNSKQIDLSRTIRLSGLGSGAKLDLVQVSRSPSVVLVALQIPASVQLSGDVTRLTERFPSNTSLWQILRQFESASPGNNNFTQRAVAQVTEGTSGSGRLTYEMPVIHVMGRDLTDFAGLQKTLTQLGITGGSVLLKLTFRDSHQPMEDAMDAISQYFATFEARDADHSLQSDRLMDDPMPKRPQVTHNLSDAGNVHIEPEVLQNSSSSTGEHNSTESTNMQASTPQAIPTQAHDDLAIFAPPSSSRPAASLTVYDESEYVPTVDHAMQHQSRLNQESRNRKLLSDAELAQQEQSRVAARAEIKEVVVRLRFPDQSQVQRSFGPDATVTDLYQLCRLLMLRPNDEAFSLRTFEQRGSQNLLVDSAQRLIGDLNWQGRVLVTVIWAEDTAPEIKIGHSLKFEYRQRAERLTVEERAPSPVPDPNTITSPKDAQQRGQSHNSEAKEARMKKLLKGLTKK